MANALLPLLRYVHRLAAGSPDDLDDGQLLERFVRRQDETAFAVLLRRHARMVWNVCLRVLRNSQDAEDAFQATFLVLVRKADSIARAERLANWLYGVAFRVARKSRARADRRLARHREMADMRGNDRGAAPRWGELAAAEDKPILVFRTGGAGYNDPLGQC